MYQTLKLRPNKLQLRIGIKLFTKSTYTESTVNSFLVQSHDAVVKASSCSVIQSFVSPECSYLLLHSQCDGVKCELCLTAAKAHSTPRYLKEQTVLLLSLIPSFTLRPEAAG